MADAKLEIVLAAKEAAAQAFSSVNKRLNDLTGSVFSLKGALAGLATGYGFKEIAGHAFQTAAGFERMQAKLDTVTKGQGLYTLNELRRWTADMPVMLKDVTDSFVTMQAMGLEPTEEMIRTLTDVSAVMGQDVFGRVVLQLGQMSSKGKVMAEDINILAEAGINARKYLQEAFGMGIDELQKSSIGISRVVKEIFKGMERDFGGASERMAGSWDSLKVQSLKSLEQIELGIMGSGINDALKGMAADAVGAMNAWWKENEYFIRQNLPGYIKAIEESVRSFVATVRYAATEVGGAAMADGLVGRILFGSWGRAGIVAAFSILDQKIKELAQAAGIQASEKGLFARTVENGARVLDLMKESAGYAFDIFVKYPADFIRTIPEIARGYRSFWTGARTAAGEERLTRGPSEAGRFRGYTGAPVYYDYGRSQVNITADEAKESAERARQADLKLKSDKALAVQKKFAEDYMKEVEGVYAFERAKLAESLKEFQEYVADKQKVALWHAAELRKIAVKEYAAGDISTDDFRSIAELMGGAENYDVEAARGRAWKANQAAGQLYGESVEEQRRAMQVADELANQERWWQTYVENVEDAARANEIFKDSMDIMSQSVADAMAKMALGTSNFKDAFASMSQAIVAGMIRMSTQQGSEALFGMLMKGAVSLAGAFSGGSTPTGMGTNTTFAGGQSMGYFSALVRHDGGPVDGGGPYRQLPSWMFERAPRLHNGLAADEYPAVLQRGERVQKKGESSNPVNIGPFYIQAQDGRVDRDSIGQVYTAAYMAQRRAFARNA